MATMTVRTVPLGRIAGIPIGLDYSWFLVFVLMTWTLAVGYFPAEFAAWRPAEYWIVGAATAALFFASVLLHELGHSVVAIGYRIPVRSITLFVFGGVAEIGGEPPRASAEFWIAIAGPAVSFALAALFTVVARVVAASEPLTALATYLAYTNAILAAFNLIPGFPLDGGRVFRALVWGVTHDLRRATQIAANLGRVVAFAFIGLGVIRILDGNLLGGLWIAFIGWFLETAAAAQVQQTRTHDLLAGHKVAAAMNRDYTVVPADARLDELFDRHRLALGQRGLVVREGAHTVGLLTLDGIQRLPRHTWPSTTAASAMTPMVDLPSVPPDGELWSAIAEMDRGGVNQLPVMAEGRLIGVLARQDVIAYLRALQRRETSQSST
jgi:Zn-dependent protease